MKKCCLFITLGSIFVLSACHSPKQEVNESLILDDLGATVLQQSYKQIQNVIRTDLQFNRGCREREIEIERCDYKNILDVAFQAFSCIERQPKEKSNKSQDIYIMNLRKHGAVCSYQLNLSWPDGTNESLTVIDDEYEFGIIYSNELYVEYGWIKLS